MSRYSNLKKVRPYEQKELNNLKQTGKRFFDMRYRGKFKEQDIKNYMKEKTIC